nr:hypothetical protein [Tanacetum cinerariifolium]
MGDIDINMLKQYLALTRGNQVPRVVRPQNGNTINIKIKSRFIGKLKENTFSWNKNDDAHEHVERVLDIEGLFNILDASHDAIILRVFPITLIEASKRWIDRIPSGTINTWVLLEKAFIERSKVVSDVGKHVVDPVLDHLDCMPSGATTFEKHVVEARHVIG